MAQSSSEAVTAKMVELRIENSMNSEAHSVLHQLEKAWFLVAARDSGMKWKRSCEATADHAACLVE